MPTRIAAWILGLLSLVSCVGYFIWTSQGNTHSAAEANLYPGPVLQRILSQISAAAPLVDWNIPWLSLLGWAAWLFAVLAIGTITRIGLRSPAEDESAATASVLAIATGFVVLALVQLALGVIGFARFPLIPAAFVAGAAACFHPRTRQAMFAAPRAAAWQWRNLTAARRILFVIAILAFSLLLIPALTPPVQSDGVRYHIGAIQEYLKAGRIGYLPSNAYSNMPFLVEMHFMGALACKAPEATQLIHLTLAIFTCLGIYTLCSSLAGSGSDSRPRLIPGLAAMLYLGTPMSAVLATWPFTDHGISLFLIACALSLTRPAVYQSRGSAIEAGVLLGGFIGTKYTMAPVAGVLLLVPLLNAKLHSSTSVSRRRSPFQGLIVAGFAASLAGGVWFLKNWINTGNPFYPLASQLFPGGEWTAETNQFLHNRASDKGMGKGILQFLTVPWNATFNWLRFESHNIGPTLLLAVLSAITAALTANRSPRRGAVAGLLLVAAVTFVIWFFSYQSNRLLLPSLALLLALTPAWLFTQSRRERVRLAIAYSLAAAYGLSWALQWSLVTTGLTPPPLPYLLGNQYRDSYRYQSLTNARAFDYLNKHVKPGEKVLLVGEHRIYGAQFDAIWSDWFDTPILAHILREQQISTLDGLLEYLESQNVRWIMINEAELKPQLESSFRPRFKPGEWQIFEALRTLDGSGVKTSNLPPGVTIIQLGAPK